MYISHFYIKTQYKRVLKVCVERNGHVPEVLPVKVVDTI